MEFNATFLASIISFLVFVFLMNKILYAPMEKIVRERQSFIDDNFNSADENYKKADGLEHQREERLVGAKDEARTKYNDSISGYKVQKGEIVKQAQEESNNELAQAYEQLNNVSNETKEGLKGRMTDLANDIVEKVLGYRSNVQGFDNDEVNKILYQ